MNLPRTAMACLLALAAGTALAADAKDKPKADKPASPNSPASPSAPAGDKGRDWSQIDTNKDGYISPEEMEAWLKANPGPAR